MAQPTKAEDYLFIDPSAFQIAGRTFDSCTEEGRFPLYGEPVAWLAECVAARNHFGIPSKLSKHFNQDEWDGVPVPMSPCVTHFDTGNDGKYAPLRGAMDSVAYWASERSSAGSSSAQAVYTYDGSANIAPGTKAGPTKSIGSKSSFLNADMADLFSDWAKVAKPSAPGMSSPLQIYPLWRAGSVLMPCLYLFVVDSLACDAARDESQGMTGTLTDKSDKGWIGTVGTGDAAIKYDDSLDDLRTAFKTRCKQISSSDGFCVFRETARGQLVSPKGSTTYGLNTALFSWINMTKVKFTFPRTNRHVKAVAPVYRIHAYWAYDAYGMNGDSGSGDQNYSLYVGAWRDVSTSTTGPATVEVLISECLNVGQDYLGGSDGPQIDGLWSWLNQKGALTIDEEYVGTGHEGYLEVLTSRLTGNLDVYARVGEWLVKFED